MSVTNTREASLPIGSCTNKDARTRMLAQESRARTLTLNNNTAHSNKQNTANQAGVARTGVAAKERLKLTSCGGFTGRKKFVHDSREYKICFHLIVTR